jgi:two-component system response regulator QseB
LLEALLGTPDEAVPRARLQAAAYGWGDEVESNALEVHIHNLRRKLGKDRIRTVRGVGYQLVSDPHA